MPAHLSPATTLREGVSADDALTMLRHMILSRAIEDRLHALYRQGRLRGRLVSGRGQEAIPVGVTLATDPGDVVCPLHRDLAAHLVRGTSPETVLLHYLGRRTGPSGGRDGDIHFGEWSRNVFPMVSHLPDSWPVAAGMGLAASLRDERDVVVAFCGEGATSTGTWHEVMNFAAVFQTPNVFVVENNRYAYSTPTSRQYRVERIADRAAAYGMPGESVDGNDAVAVLAAARRAVTRARSGGGPTLIEAHTMRMDGHAVHDGAEYVPQAELDEWRARDPIRLLTDELESAGASPASISQLRDEVHRAVETAVESAEAAPLPEARSVLDGVYAVLPKEGSVS
jgi:TPP-dependent pyruvate/acetoin dehydrogenase alpha subunit